MNGISLDQFGDFTKDWRLVTVRYRQDTGEMRFTYANPIAFEALSKKKLPFPEGSVFAKVGLKTGLDPAFTSSVVPSRARRFQFMVKDSRKYASYDGWGYALFNSDGGLFEGDLRTQTIACQACHRAVPERDFVFSEPVELSPFVKGVMPSDPGGSARGASAANPAGARFLLYSRSKKSARKLASLLKKLKVTELRILDGEIRQHFFGGTLDEVTPVLIHELGRDSGKKNLAIGFVSSDEEVFKVILESHPDHGTPACAASEMALEIWEARSAREPAQRQLLCFPKPMKE